MKAVTKTAPAKKAGPATKAAPATKAVSTPKAASTTKAAPAKKASSTKKAVPASNGSAPSSLSAPREAPALQDARVLQENELAELIASARVDTATRAEAKRLPVRPGEEPWTTKDLAEVKTELVAEIDRLLLHLEASASEMVDLLRDGSDGAGRDPADVGSSNFERDHEMSLAYNAQQALAQSASALQHIRAGTYGICDHCGEPIGKGRLQAFPRATLCVTCKQREERR